MVGKVVLMNELEILARKFGTDKQTNEPGATTEYHGYTTIYDQLFNDHRLDYKNVLELGLWFGSSHFMWNEYFHTATIWGVDNFSGQAYKFRQENPYINPVELNEKISELVESFERAGIRVIVCDQMDKAKILEALTDIELDVIIDDGGHGSWQQQVSFSFLWDKIKSGGYYIIEDLGVCAKREFRQYDDIRSATDMWLESMNTDNPFSYYMSEEFLMKVKEEIECVDIVGELGIIKKK
jgi:hypothetical protein